MSPTEALRRGLSVNQDGVVRSGFDLLGYADIGFDDLRRVWPELGTIAEDAAAFVATEARYAVYLDRQASDAEALKRDEDLRLPVDLDYGAIGGLSNEVRGKLSDARPVSIGHAARIDGMTPAALTVLLAHVRKRPDRFGSEADGR